MRTFAITGVLLTSSLLAAGGENLTPEVFLPGYEKTDAHAPAAAFGKDVFLVVWEAGRNENADIVGIRLDKTGKVLDAKPFVISGAKDCQERPRVAFGGGVFLVVWQDLRNEKDYDTYAARVTPEGKVLDPDGIAAGAEKHNQAQPVVCFDGRAFQLVWRDMRNGVSYDLYGNRIGPDGRMLDGKGVLQQPGFKATWTTKTGVPGVGANGSGGVFAGAFGKNSIQLWPVKDGKQAAKPKPSFTGPKLRNAWAPRFASDGKNFLVTFTTYQPISRGGTSQNSGAVLLNADGKNVPTSVIPVSVGQEKATCIRNPSPVWDGKTYVVAWDIEVGPRSKTHWDVVCLRRISREGVPQGANTPVAGEKGSPAYHPAAASDGAGTTLVAYERGPKTGAVPIKIAFPMLR